MGLYDKLPTTRTAANARYTVARRSTHCYKRQG